MNKDFTLHVKIWIEKNGKPVLGPGRLEILEAINRTQSLTDAAKFCQISFRKAWKLINEINESLEQPVVISERGGKGGGGQTMLTEYGKKIIKQYQNIQKAVNNLIQDPKIWSDF
ncbi:MAG: LysR family transcriptional regulator [Candidatus Heimdallarchaeota archaeon]|nr:LysR family transcriptional regulator [Candidatus Heimdallarchaeota archaeon]